MPSRSVTNGAKTDGRAVVASEKAVRALELRKQGRTFRYIAAVLGYKGPQGAHEAVRKALIRTVQPAADEVRQLEAERLDALLEAAWRLALMGDLQAIDRVLRIMERRAALLGLDAPQKVDIEARVRVVARENGLDEEEAVAEARRYLREARGPA